MAGSDFAFFRNEALTDGVTTNRTSNVGEPSLANRGDHLLATGNWWAARSSDDAATWAPMSPFTTFPASDGGFCCDQVALYEPSRDLMIWLLQYRRAGGTNRYRLAIARSTDLRKGFWTTWSITPAGLNPAWGDLWLDYPDMATSNDHLFITSNMYDNSRPNARWQRSIVLRIDLDSLADGGSYDYRLWSSTDSGSPRPTRGARRTMYFASHASNTRVRVHAWPDDSTSVDSFEVGVSATAGGRGNYDATGPDGNNWLARCDSRITAAYVARGVLGFMWTSAQQGDRPFPFIRHVRIDEQTRALIDEPDWWSRSAAFAYPDAQPNDRGDIGYTYFFGGGRYHPWFCVGIDDDHGSTRYAARRSTHGPADDKWGDYLSVRRHSPDGLTWCAIGYTLQGGSSNRDVEAQYVHFGRERDRRGVQRWS